MGTKFGQKNTVPSKIWIQNDLTKSIQNDNTKWHHLVYKMGTISISICTTCTYNMYIQNLHTKCTYKMYKQVLHTFDIHVYKMGTKFVLSTTVPSKIWIQMSIQDCTFLYKICIQNRVFHCNAIEIIVTKWLHYSHSRKIFA